MNRRGCHGQQRGASEKQPKRSRPNEMNAHVRLLANKLAASSACRLRFAFACPLGRIYDRGCTWRALNASGRCRRQCAALVIGLRSHGNSANRRVSRMGWVQHTGYAEESTNAGMEAGLK